MDLGELTATPASSAGPAGRLDPRWKLAAVACAIGCTLLLRGLLPLSLSLLGTVVLSAWARLPWRWVAARLALVLPFIVFLALPLPWLAHTGPDWHWGPLRASIHGTAAALGLFTRALTVLLLVLFLLGTAPLHVTLQGARALGAPGLLAQLVLLSHRYVFVLAEELARMRLALRVRGYRNRANRHSYRTVAHVAGTLLIRGHERAERVAHAMRCRGFDGRPRSLTEFQTGPRDTAFFVAVTAYAVALLLFDR